MKKPANIELSDKSDIQPSDYNSCSFLSDKTKGSDRPPNEIYVCLVYERKNALPIHIFLPEDIILSPAIPGCEKHFFTTFFHALRFDLKKFRLATFPFLAFAFFTAF